MRNVVISYSIFTTFFVVPGYALKLGQVSWYRLLLAPDSHLDTGELGGHVVLLALGQPYSVVPFPPGRYYLLADQGQSFIERLDVGLQGLCDCH